MYCIVCQQPLRWRMSWVLLFHQGDCDVCDRCLEQLERFEGEVTLHGVDTVTVHYRYNDFLKDVIYSYKAIGHIRLARLFSDVLRPLRRVRQATVIPIPSHARKVKTIGFQPIEQLLRVADVPFTVAFDKVYDGELSRLRKRERQRIRHIVQLRDSVVLRPHCILVDDVVTTGGTILQAAAQLRARGVERIDVVTVSRPT